MRLGALSQAELGRQLRQGVLTLSMAPFTVRIRSDVPQITAQIARMYGDILLFLPSTAANMRRMGLDFDLPISQAECIRKDIQVGPSSVTVGVTGSCLIVFDPVLSDHADSLQARRGAGQVHEGRANHRFGVCCKQTAFLTRCCSQRTCAPASRTRTSSASASPASCRPISLTVRGLSL